MRQLFIILSLCLPTRMLASQPEDTTRNEENIKNSELKEIVVTAGSARQRIENMQLGSEHLELAKLSLTPNLGGEQDIIRSIALLPGVRSEADGGGGFEVRGGTSWQNLILLDGITLYNPSHVMGIFSTFNDNAIGRATLFKGPFPAPFGGATSSVLETSLAPGDLTTYHASASIGILAAKAHVDGPICKDKFSFSLDARRSYVDAFLKMVPKYRGTIMNFYDISAKIRFRPSQKHLLDASFFISHDNMAIKNVMGMYWGNLGASLNWIARPNDNLNFTTTAAFDHFSPKMRMAVMQMNEEIKEFIHSYSINEGANLQMNESHSLEAGLRSELLQVKSGEWWANGIHEKEMRAVWDNSFWINYEGDIKEKWKINGGIRFNATTVLSSPHWLELINSEEEKGNDSGETYFDVEPRMSMAFNLSECNNLKLGAGLSSQNLHAVRSSATSFPFDRYALTSKEIKPERVFQLGFGYTGMTSDGAFDWSAECYYKSLRNVYDFKDGRNSFSSIDLQSVISGGKGRSYGLEIMFRKNNGRLTGWIGYSLSQTQTCIEGINNGRWYNASNDRRHELSVVSIFKLSERWILSGSWIYYSGNPLTAPDVKYELSGVTCYYYSQRNSYKTPPTHRLDLSATYTHEGKRLTYEWAFGIYNAYCRYNPYIIYFEDDPTKPSGTRAVQQSMYGLIPSVSYTLKF